MSQQSPYNLNQNIAIRACAGAGKTYTLTWRYMVILDHFANLSSKNDEKNWLGPANILAITFTKKATAELKSRILKTLNTVLSGENYASPIELIHLKNVDITYINWMKRQLLSPNIMTIDAFCTSILKDNPIASGVDSGMKIMDEYESNIFYTKYFQRYFSELSKNDMIELAINFGANNISNIFIDALKDQSQLQEIMFKYELEENEIFNSWVVKYQVRLNYLPLVESIYKCAEIIINSSLPIEIKEDWDTFYKISGEIIHPECLRKNELFKMNLFPIILTSDGKFRARLGKTGNKSQWKKAGLDKSIFDDLLNDYKNEKTLINPSDIFKFITDEEINHIKLIKKMLVHFKNWFQFIDINKGKNRVLTFKDLLFKSNFLLNQNNQIKNKISKNLHHIMVDEFQDTTHSHWDLIKSIFQKDGQLKKSGMFIVGDEKQSIYRFNQADVTTFSCAINDFENVDSNFRPIELKWNFRSTEKLINECINPLFKNLFLDTKSNLETFKAVHQETVSHPESENKDLPENTRVLDKSMVLDLMYISEKNNSQGNELIYPKHIASIVKSILEKNPKIENNCIGILLRAVKPVIGIYSEAFSELGVKAEIIASSSFYQSQEVMDIEMLISLLLNPYDDIAFCGILKSPFFSFTDTEIHQLISSRKNISIYKFLSSQNHFVISELNEWINASKTIPIDRLIENIINSKNRELSFLSEPNGEQCWVNIYKLISIIHNWSLAGDSIEKIRNLLKGHIKGNFHEDNYKISSNTQVVIMSIHKSKGLSFPFVIIPEIQKKFFTDNISRMNIDYMVDNNGNRNIELAFAPKDDNWNTKQFALTKQLKEQQKKEVFEENKRLLYVAITRAKYGVILSGKITEKDLDKEVGVEFKNSKSWLDWLRKLYPIDSQIVENTPEIDILNGPKIKINSIDEIDILNQPKSNELIEYFPKKNTPSENSFVKLSVTQIFSCYINEEERLDDLIKNSPERGTLIHKILEKGWLNYSKYKIEIKNWIQSQDISFNASIEKIDIPEIIRVLKQNKKVLQLQNINESNCFKELWLQTKLVSKMDAQQILLTGIIDILYLENNQWYILDYKTGSKKNGSIQYKNQLQTYLHMVKFCYGISAIGQIFYIDEDLIETIKFETNFLNEININSQNGFQFQQLQKNAIINEISEFNREIKTTIIASNNKRKSDIWFSLITHKILIPQISITTFSEFKSKCLEHKKSTAPIFVKRQIILKIFNEKLGRFDLKNLPGIVDKLVEAFEIHSETNEILENELFLKFNHFKNEIEKLDYVINYPFIENIDKYLEDNSTYLIEKPALVKQGDILFLNSLLKHGNISIFNDNPCLYDNDFQKSVENKIQNNSIQWFGFNSIQDEINYIFSKINSEIINGYNFSDFTIVLPSMERYLPQIAGLFRREGIPLSIRKSEPISENQIVKSVISFFNLCVNNKINWIDIKSWVESPLNRLTDFLPLLTNEILYEIDILVRKKDYHTFEKLNFEELKFLTKNDNLIIEIESLSTHLNRLNKISLKELIYTFRKQLVNKLNNSSFLPLKELLNLITETLKLSESFQFKLTDQQLLNEINHLHTQVEYSPKETDWGVEIISIMDSLNLKNKYIFVPGLNRDVFPVQIKPNPFIKNTNYYHEKSNYQILNSWILNPGKLILSYPIFNDKNEELDPTLFMDGISAEINEQSIIIESKIKIRDTIGKLIKCKKPSEDLIKIIKKHNAFIEESIPLNYFGFIENYKLKPENRNFSATSLDELFLKPYFYLLKRDWQIMEIDYEQSIGLDKGDFIHKILEIFGKNDGWYINRKNHQKGIELFNQLSEKFLQNYSGSFRLNIEELFWTSPTLFENILNEDYEKTPNFIHLMSEGNFGKDSDDTFKELSLIHPKLGEINFKGKIDRVDISKDKKSILIQDYKTGKINWDKLEGEMSRQLFIYYLVLKNEYKNALISVSYRSVRDINNYGFYSGFILEDTIENYFDLNLKNSKKHIFIEDLMDVENQILNCFNPMLENQFHLFSERNSNINLDSYYYLKAVSRIESIKYLLTNN